MRPTAFWDCAGLLCLSYFQSDGRLILTQLVTLLFLSLLIATFCSMKSMVYISITTATISMLIPQDIVDGRPVPVFFRGRPTIYHIFLSCTLFAFLGSFSSLMVHHKPRVERVFRIYAVASMIFALIFLSCTIFAFLGSFSSLMVQHKPRVERVFRIYAWLQWFLHLYF